MNDTSTRSPRDVSVNISLEGRGSFSASGPDALVFKALEEFKVAIAASPPPKVERKAAPAADEEKQETTPGAGKGSHPGPLAPFMREKAPKTNPEAVAVMAVWDHLKNGTTEWTADSIAALWRNSSRAKAGNLGRDIDSAVKSGWLERSERGKYQWNQFGQDFVENDLPRAPKKG